MKISIVIPAHNEESRIRPMLDAYLPYFQEKYGEEVELIIVVNGSTDITPDIATAYAEKTSNVTAIIEPRTIGKGGAIIRGFRKASGDLIGFVDADGSTPPKAYDDLNEMIGSAGCAIASRWLPESNVELKQPLSRRIVSRVFNMIVRCMFSLRITDTQCGAKVLRAEVVRVILPRLGLTRWAFDVDVLFHVRRAGYAIVEVPTEWHDVAGSKLRVARTSFEMFIAICRLRMLHSPLKWVVDVYDKTLGRIIRTEA